MKVQRWLPWALLTLTVSLMGGATYFAYLNRATGVDGFRLIDFIWGSGWLAFPVVGTIVASRRPENAVGWLACTFGMPILLSLFADEYATYAIEVSSRDLAGGHFMLWLAQWPFFVSGALIVSMFLLFPEGKLPSRRWRVVSLLVVAFAAMGSIAAAVGKNTNENPVAENPLFIPSMESLSESLQGFAGNALGALMVLAVASIFLRFRKATAEERKQVKWFLYGLAVMLSLFLLLFILEDIAEAGVPEPFDTLIFVVAVTAPPIGMGIGVLRYRLYDIDLVINKTLVYGALAGFITLIYVAVVVGIGSLVGSGSGSRGPNLGLSVAATAIVAVAFQPMRSRIQGIANRLVYGQRLSPYEAVSSFSHRMSESFSADELLPRMAEAAANAVGAEVAKVSLELPSGDHRDALFPPVAMPREFDLTIPVSHRGERVGSISVSKKRGEQLSQQDQTLLSNLATQAGLALKNLRLTEELRARIVQLQDSRKRIVAAQDTERRRMERDIHDGAQQQLVAMSVKLALAQSVASKDPMKANSILDELKAETGDAVQTLRDLARGIFPAILSDRGPAAALQGHIEKMGIEAVIVDETHEARFAEETEAATYFVIREALQNATKHAGGKAITIRISNYEGALRFTVTDQGRGFDPSSIKKGSGLENMRDRVEALGGTLDIESSSDGTRIAATIPSRDLVSTR